MELEIEVLDYMPKTVSDSKWMELIETLKTLHVGQVIKAKMPSQKELEHARSHIHTLISRKSYGFENMYTRMKTMQGESGDLYLLVKRVA